MDPRVAAACALVLDWLWNNPRTTRTEGERDLVLAEIREMVSMVARQEGACREMCGVGPDGVSPAPPEGA